MNDTRRRPLRLLHTSDLHIGTDIYPGEALRGFEAVLQTARDSRADAILIAGDLFDSGRVPQSLVSRVWDDLGATGLPVIVLPGNHDLALTSGEAHSPPDNVTLLMESGGQAAFAEALGLTVWGRPVYDHHPGFRPLAEVPERPDGGWYVVIAHGLLMDRLDPYRSSPISPHEIASAPCDYVALGHVHVFREVSQNGVPAFYCGAPSGYQRKTVALVALDPGSGASVTAVEIG
ncbi:MAG: metallophosphoesterase [Chloroflexi bacterium]|nr:metallophosphoesterase [Chloroflexota bacterium]